LTAGHDPGNRDHAEDQCPVAPFPVVDVQARGAVARVGEGIAGNQQQRQEDSAHGGSLKVFGHVLNG
jgi:hypothetical protein